MANCESIENYKIENQNNIELSDGEVMCPKCEGRSTVYGQGTGMYNSCDRCWGSGKLDWIELVMGKERPYALSGYSSSSSRSSSRSTKQTTKRRNVNGSNTEFGLGTIQRLSEMFNKSKGSLQRRRYKIRRRKTEK